MRASLPIITKAYKDGVHTSEWQHADFTTTACRHGGEIHQFTFSTNLKSASYMEAYRALPPVTHTEKVEFFA